MIVPQLQHSWTSGWWPTPATEACATHSNVAVPNVGSASMDAAACSAAGRSAGGVAVGITASRAGAVTVLLAERRYHRHPAIELGVAVAAAAATAAAATATASVIDCSTVNFTCNTCHIRWPTRWW